MVNIGILAAVIRRHRVVEPLEFRLGSMGTKRVLTRLLCMYASESICFFLDGQSS
jgi:hypothetical protein